MGTHSLTEDSVIFKNLGLIVIDEEQRFGVEKREKCGKKQCIIRHMFPCRQRRSPEPWHLLYTAKMLISSLYRVCQAEESQ